MIIDAINLLNSVFSDKDSAQVDEKIPEEESKQSPLQRRTMVRKEYEKKKREY